MDYQDLVTIIRKRFASLFDTLYNFSKKLFCNHQKNLHFINKVHIQVPQLF